MRWAVVREWCARVALSAALMVFGADIWSLYLYSTGPLLASKIDRLDDWFNPTLLALLILYHVLRPKKDIDAFSDISPRLSGAVTVMLVGTAAAIALVSDSSELATGAFLLSILATVAVWRFATKNADRIGEASFGAARD